MQRKRGFHLNLWLVLWSHFFIMDSPTKSINDMCHLGKTAIAG